MRQCSSVSSIPPFDQMLLFVRHAERSPISDLRIHAAAMLTEQGKSDSEVLGRVLGNRFLRIAVWHSPVPRCRDTADRMIRGMRGTPCEVRPGGPLAWLSGDFMEADPEWINKEVVNGDEDFFSRWSGGCYSGDQLISMKEAAAIELEKAFQQMENADSPVIIDVTHDWNILVLRESCLGVRFQEVGLPDYLDSIAILRRGSSLALWSIGRSCIVKA